jgi:hypothetical protein
MRFARLLPALGLLGLVPALAIAAGTRTRHYEGSGDRAKFTVTFDRHAHTTDYEVTFDGPCDAPNTTEGAAYGTSSTPGERPLHVGRHGRFHMRRHYRSTISGTIIDIHFAGRLRRNTGAGTFIGRLTNDGDGGQTVHCSTGRVRWTAHRR